MNNENTVSRDYLQSELNEFKAGNMTREDLDEALSFANYMAEDGQSFSFFNFCGMLVIVENVSA